jgi:nucleoside-triphosphatase THEP1
MNKNIFLTGATSSGKTIVNKKIISKPDMPVQSFYTEVGRTGDRIACFRY